VVFVSQLNSSTTHPLTARVRNVTTTGFEVKLQKESAIKTSISKESVAYLAITQGTGAVNDQKLIVGKTADNVIKTTGYTKIDFGATIEDPVFIAQMQTCNDDTVTAVIRTLSISTSFANITKQRERSTGVTVAGNETAGWMVLEPVKTSLTKHSAQARLGFYPNPVKDVLYLTRNISEGESFEIFNMYGVLQKRVHTAGNTIDVSDLAPGTYLIRSEKSGNNKFMKF
jgi:hypothetical protein